jgi:hypothetical protein
MSKIAISICLVFKFKEAHEPGMIMASICHSNAHLPAEGAIKPPDSDYILVPNHPI